MIVWFAVTVPKSYRWDWLKVIWIVYSTKKHGDEKEIISNEKESKFNSQVHFGFRSWLSKSKYVYGNLITVFGAWFCVHASCYR